MRVSGVFRGFVGLLLAGVIVCDAASVALAKKVDVLKNGRARLDSGLVIQEISENTGHIDLSHGKLKRSFASGVASLDGVQVDAEEKSVTILYSVWCSAGTARREAVLAQGELEASLERETAAKLEKKKQLVEAEAAYARAYALYAGAGPAVDLARVRMLQNKRDAAIEALKPVLAQQPHATLAVLLGDATVAPLVDAPEVHTALGAAIATPGTATIEAKKLRLPASFVLSSDVLAFVRDVYEDGSGGHSADLRVIRISTGRAVATLPLVSTESSEAREPRARRERRIAAANRYLRELGFAAPPDAEVGVVKTEDGDTPKRKIFFARAKLGVVASERGVRLLRGDEALDKQTLRGGMGWAVHLPAQQLVVVGWSTSGDYHHGEEAEEGVTILRLKPR